MRSRRVESLRSAGLAIADTILDATVAPSWSSTGYQLRSRMWSWAPAPSKSMEGRTVLVTGGTSGIGRATALALSRAGADVGIVGRDRRRTQEVAAELAAEAALPAERGAKHVGTRQSPKVWGEAADLASTAEVEDLARRVADRLGVGGRLDALVHSAGQISPGYGTSPEGTERTVAVHVVATHLLTSRLLPALRTANSSAVVWVSSGGMYTQALDVALLSPSPERYNGLRCYALAKRAQVVLAHLWSQRHGSEGIAFLAMHPGWVGTRALEEGLPTFARLARGLLRTPEEGADTVVWLAGGAAGERPAPAFWFDRRQRREHFLPSTKTPPAEAEKLWAWCEERSRARWARQVARERR